MTTMPPLAAKPATPAKPVRPTVADIVAVCKLMKLGKQLAVGEVSLYSDGQPDPVAHAVGTYAIPPR